MLECSLFPLFLVSWDFLIVVDSGKGSSKIWVTLDHVVSKVTLSIDHQVVCRIVWSVRIRENRIVLMIYVKLRRHEYIISLVNELIIGMSKKGNI